jgi:hypothetical protein
MTTTQAATFAIETIGAAKTSMITNGISDPKMIYAVCNKLSAMLSLPLDLVIDIMGKA